MKKLYYTTHPLIKIKIEMNVAWKIGIAVQKINFIYIINKYLTYSKWVKAKKTLSGMLLLIYSIINEKWYWKFSYEKINMQWMVISYAHTFGKDLLVINCLFSVCQLEFPFFFCQT